MIGGIASFFGIDNARVAREELQPVVETPPVAKRQVPKPNADANSPVNITLSANARAYLEQLSADQAYVATTRPNIAQAPTTPVSEQPTSATPGPNNTNPEVKVQLPGEVAIVQDSPSPEAPDDLVSDVVQTIRDVLAFARDGAGVEAADIATLEAAARDFDTRLSEILQNVSGDRLTDFQAEEVIEAESTFFAQFDAIFGLELTSDEATEVSQAEAAYQAVFDEIYGEGGNRSPSREELNRLQEAEQSLQSQLDSVFGPELFPEQEQRLGTALENFNTIREQYFAGIAPDELPDDIRGRLEGAEDIYLQTLNTVFSGKATYTRQQDRQIQQAQAFFTDAVQRAARDFYQLGQSS